MAKKRTPKSVASGGSAIESVIPDLYLAAARAPSGSVYRFVTEGTIGDWSDVYDAFRSFRDRMGTNDTPYDILNGAVELDLRGRFTLPATHVGGGTVTEKALFDHIVSAVHARPAIALSEDLDATRNRLVSVLANFEFVGGRNADIVTHEIDTFFSTSSMSARIFQQFETRWRWRSRDLRSMGTQRSALRSS